MSEDNSKRAMADAARLAEELRHEQEHAGQIERLRRGLESQVYTVNSYNSNNVNKISYVLSNMVSLQSFCRRGKGKGQTLVIAHSSKQSHRRGAQVHGAHQAASHIRALNLLSRIAGIYLPTQRGWRVE